MYSCRGLKLRNKRLKIVHSLATLLQQWVTRCNGFLHASEWLSNHGCIYIFFWIPYWPRMLINILWPPLDANQYGGHVWRTWSIFSCCKGLWDVFLPTPITTKHQTVFWLVSQSRRMSAICVGSCRWISLAAACDDPVGELACQTPNNNDITSTIPTSLTQWGN